MAGYQTVIATMWSIGDGDAPLVAEKLYQNLLERVIPDERRAALAVPKATEHLHVKVGTEAFERWMPYVHIGRLKAWPNFAACTCFGERGT